jgi:hypothetical protein
MAVIKDDLPTISSDSKLSLKKIGMCAGSG